ncbi:MAG: hypothetical protein IPK03_10320 [Bacteroidetes bacterium]|nr:hypothetical protein [Bacteroidota bacterium]
MRNFFASLIMMLGLAAANAQSVTVTQPNGGEVLYGCQNYLIKWNSSGVSNFWNIDYSLNGGSIWVSVASNLNITNGQYSWTVPMVASTNVLVRVLDYNAPSKRDSSNAPFTIQLPILVTSPNGGENWQGLSSKNITWTPAGTSGIFNISYSTNNGGSWASIATNIAANNYTWNPVANNPSTQALIRVQDATTACQQDQSDLVFELSSTANFE